MAALCFEKAGIFEKIETPCFFPLAIKTQALNSFLTTNEPGNGNCVKIQLA
jgi:hypothetical protein